MYKRQKKDIIFCKLNAAPLGEVASAVCAEVGGVKFSFIRILRKPLSHDTRSCQLPYMGAKQNSC